MHPDVSWTWLSQELAAAKGQLSKLWEELVEAAAAEEKAGAVLEDSRQMDLCMDPCRFAVLGTTELLARYREASVN